MTKSELIDAVSDRFPQLLRIDTELAVNEILDAIARTLANGRRVEIRRFGVFSLNYRPSRIGRNPKTGEAVHVPGIYTPHFKAGKNLREGVDFQSAQHNEREQSR